MKIGLGLDGRENLLKHQQVKRNINFCVIELETKKNRKKCSLINYVTFFPVVEPERIKNGKTWKKNCFDRKGNRKTIKKQSPGFTLKLKKNPQELLKNIFFIKIFGDFSDNKKKKKEENKEGKYRTVGLNTGCICIILFL